MGIALSLNVVDSDIVIIGGESSWRFSFDKIKNISKYAMKTIADKIIIKASTLGNDAGIYGACYLAQLLSN